MHCPQCGKNWPDTFKIYPGCVVPLVAVEARGLFGFIPGVLPQSAQQHLNISLSAASPADPMTTPAQLLERLAAIGESLAATGRALALLGLGSVGLERERLDAYSDLDFFAVVRPGEKARFLADHGWLSAVASVAYAFQNTADGYKLLFGDGIFCEFAVFEPQELADIPFAEGRIVWQADGFDARLCAPAQLPRPREPHSVTWLLGEALTNLYVGLGRYRRGEKLSALRFVQGYAVDHALELAALLEPEQPAGRDPFTPERRFEQRFPGAAALLPAFMQGYERTPASAAALLAFLEAHFEVNAAFADAIRALLNAILRQGTHSVA